MHNMPKAWLVGILGNCTGRMLLPSQERGQQLPVSGDKAGNLKSTTHPSVTNQEMKNDIYEEGILLFHKSFDSTIFLRS